MSVRNWLPKEVTQPRGAWTAKGLFKNSPNRASIAQNVRFFPDYVYSREGTSNVGPTSGGKVSGMFNWISPSDNWLVYQDGTSIKKCELSSNTVTTLSSSLGGARAPSIQDYGSQIFFCGWDTNGNGTMNALVHDGASATDTCFRGPLPTFTTFTATDGGGGGQCTLGQHQFAILFQSRSGFIGQPSPVTSGALAPASVTLSAGLHSITLVVTFNTPSDAGTGSAIYVIMTRADNQFAWFILPPAAYTASNGIVPPANTTGWSTTFTINISDEDLAQQTSALPNFSYLVFNGVGTQTPPNPSYAVAYGTRVIWGAGKTVYASDAFNPQVITGDLNVIQNPRGRNIKAAFPIGQVLFLTGDKWTGAVMDSGDSASTWPPPSTISDSIGAPYPNCVSSKVGNNYAWVASEFGLYYFNGAFQDRPITYLYSDQWKRINWNAAYAIQIADDVTNLKCYVSVPLDSNTECSHTFVIDYTYGREWDTVDISTDNYGFGNFSSICTVKEATSNKTAVWIGPQAAGNFNHIDPTTHQDAGSTIIHAIWESGYVRQQGEQDSSTVRVGTALIWASGSGTLLPTWYGMDRTINVTPMLETPGAVAGQVPLSSSPGQEYLVAGDLSPVENYTMRFEVNSLGDWFQLRGFRAYTRATVYNR